MRAMEVACSCILSKSKIPGVNYAINPFVGCLHGCVYCYARFAALKLMRPAEWGSKLYVKANALLILAKEVSRARRGLVLFSSVTDPYQSIEVRYRLTRQLLQQVANAGFDALIETKSPNVLMDLDLIKKHNVEVGISISSLHDEVKEIFETKAPKPDERAKALSKLSSEGIRTFLFISPILPGFTDSQVDELFELAKSCGVSKVLIDRLNPRSGNWKFIRDSLERVRPDLVQLYRRAMFEGDYFQQLKPIFIRASRKWRVPTTFCY